MARSVGVAIVVSVVVHGLVGLSIHALKPDPPLLDIAAPILVGLGPSQSGDPSASGVPWPVDDPDSLRLMTEGTATVRCHSDGRGHVSKCRWLSESAPGWGDEAVRRLDGSLPFYGEEGRTRGSVTFDYVMCTGVCPVF